MKTDTKQTENLAEWGNKSKPLLAEVILTENEKWKTVCEIVVQHALFEHIHVSDTIELLKSKFNLV